MRPPVDHIAAPPFPGRLPWLNVATLRMDQQIGRPVLVEFFDFCQPSSLRTLPHVKTWHERYEPLGLRVVSVQAPGSEPAREEVLAEVVAALGISHPVVLDRDFQIWKLYGNLGWPARYLWNQQGLLHDYHYGEGGYDESEAAICELLGTEPPPFVPLRPEEEPGAELIPPSEPVSGPYNGPYQGGGVWAVVSGPGSLRVNGEEVIADHAGALELISHPRSAQGVLELIPGPGVEVLQTIFTPGLRAG